ncbi:unnamed protein product [Sphagnum troendelagicum]|jgi:hypothetical protein
MSRFERWIRAEPIATGLRELADVRAKDVSGFMRENFSPNAVVSRARAWRNGYRENYIDTDSIQPLYDALLTIGLLSYAMAWSIEIRHLRAIQELRRLQEEQQKQQTQQQQQQTEHH